MEVWVDVFFSEEVLEVLEDSDVEVVEVVDAGTEVEMLGFVFVFVVRGEVGEVEEVEAEEIEPSEDRGVDVGGEEVEVGVEIEPSEERDAEGDIEFEVEEGAPGEDMEEDDPTPRLKCCKCWGLGVLRTRKHG